MSQYKSPVDEWYEEAYEDAPSEPPALYNPDLQVGDLYLNVNGDVLGIVTAVDHKLGQVSVMSQGQFAQFQKVIAACGRRMRKNVETAFAPLLKAFEKTQADFVLFPPPLKTAKPFAGKPPHCMAPPPGARLFGPRGRKRY